MKFNQPHTTHSRRYLLLAASLLLGLGSCQSEGRLKELLRLQRLDDALLGASAELDKDNADLVRGIHADVVRNRNQPADTLVLHQAEVMRDSTRALLAYLDERRQQLLRGTGNEAHFRQLDENTAVRTLLPPAVARQVQRRLTAYHAYLRQQAPPMPGARPLPAAHTQPLPAFDFQAAPVMGALAALAEAGSHALLHEEAALTTLSRRIESAELLGSPVRLLATAEQATVAPGGTYRAELMLVSALHSANQPLRMTANGQAVPVDSAGFGEVAFPVPARPGRYAWQAVIRFRYQGRDTVYRASVPYTVLPR